MDPRGKGPPRTAAPAEVSTVIDIAQIVSKTSGYRWRSRIGYGRQPLCRAARSGSGWDQADFGPHGRVLEARRAPMRCRLRLAWRLRQRYRVVCETNR